MRNPLLRASLDRMPDVNSRWRAVQAVVKEQPGIINARLAELGGLEDLSDLYRINEKSAEKNGSAGSLK
jgi:hypothetical protein